MMRIRLFAAVALLSAAAPVAGQESPAVPPKTGSVAGVVIEEKSEDCIAKALVILRRDQEGGIGQITGSDGKFTIRDLDPGTYILAVERDGYVVARGQTQTVTVQSGQTVSDVKLKLQRTGTIAGRILDADGDPVSGVSVVASAMRSARDARSAAGYATTNDRGEYRIFHLAPGEYRIAATCSPRSGFDGVRIQPPVLAPGAAPAAGVEAYPTVYYPGVVDARQAAGVKVEPGAELPGFDLQLVRAHGVRVRGRVSAASSTAPLFQMVSLVPIGQRDSPGQPLNVLLRDAKGEFEFQGVLPGSYRLQVDAAALDQSSRMSVARTLDVGASDIDGIELTLGQPQDVSGRMIAPEGRKLPSGLFVMLAPREPGATQSGGLAQVGDAGTFTISKVAPGQYDVVAGSSAEEDDSYISAIRMGDTDALVEGVHIGEGPVPQLDIVLKANGGAAECMVKDDKGAPAPEATVLLVPDPPRQRQAALSGECRTSADGACKILGITPGEYHLYAFPAGTQIDRRDPGALKPYEKYGEAITFAEGGRKQVNLKTAPIE